MKHQFLTLATCALLLLAAGCKKDEPTPTPETFNSNVSAPTWTDPQESDMTSSMTAVIKIDLKAQYPDQTADWQLSDQDLLAAFQGDDCLGIAEPQDGLFYLYIASPTSSSVSDPTSNSEAVTLRYYSAHYKNLFEAKDAFPFVNDDHLGTVAEPLIPTFVVVK